MDNQFSKVVIKNISNNFDNLRIPLSAKERLQIKKVYPYYGAQSIIDYVDDYLFDGEYILVAEDGENLKSQKNNVCNLVDGKFWVNNHAHIIKARDGHSTKYLYYYLNLINFKPFITGSAQPKLTKDNLNSIPLNIHDKYQQHQIAKILSDLDDKIKLNNKINQQLEAMAKTLYDYWFVQFDFPDANGNPYKSSGGKMVYDKKLKREIPEGWEVVPLNNCIDLLLDHRGKTPKKLGGDWTTDKNGIIALSAKIVKNEKLKNLKKANKVSFEMYDKWMPVKLKNGDFLMTSEAPTGEFYFIYGKTDYCMSQRLFAIRANKTKVFPSYLYYEMSKGHGFSQIMGSRSGSTVSGIRQDELRKILIVKPCLDIQKRFDDIALPLLKQIKSLDEQNQQLTKLRDWLLPMLMNGQVTVKQAQEEMQLQKVAEPKAEYNM